MIRKGLFALALATGLFASACASHKSHHAEGDEHHMMWAKVDKAVAVLHPTEGNQAKGVIRFAEANGQVQVVADIEGLEPGSTHGIHVHEFGDCTAADGASAGGHYNPEGHEHGLPAAAPRHAGDLGNLTADGAGKVHYEITVDNITIAGMKNPIVGRGVIVHAKPDTGAQPTGDAGARIACGVVGIAKSGE